MAKKTPVENTFRYAVAFYLEHPMTLFRVKGKTYRFIQTVYDKDSNQNTRATIVVAWDYKASKYAMLNLNDPKIADAEVGFPSCVM